MQPSLPSLRNACRDRWPAGRPRPAFPREARPHSPISAKKCLRETGDWCLWWRIDLGTSTSPQWMFGPELPERCLGGSCPAACPQQARRGVRVYRAGPLRAAVAICVGPPQLLGWEAGLGVEGEGEQQCDAGEVVHVQVLPIAGGTPYVFRGHRAASEVGQDSMGERGWAVWLEGPAPRPATWGRFTVRWWGRSSGQLHEQDSGAHQLGNDEPVSEHSSARASRRHAEAGGASSRRCTAVAHGRGERTSQRAALRWAAREQALFFSR